MSAQVRTVLREAIQRGQFADGKIPPEPELSVSLGVSRTTVRSALQTLEHEGLIVRTPGRGTVVVQRSGTAFSFELQRLIGFSTMLRESGETGDVDVVWKKGEPPLPESASRLDIGLSESCYVSEKTFRTKRGIALYLQDVVPFGTLDRKVATSQIPASLFDFSERFWNEPISYAKVEIVPSIADKNSKPYLGIESGAFLTLLETHYSSHSAPLAFSKVYVNDHFVRFSVTRQQ